MSFSLVMYAYKKCHFSFLLSKKLCLIAPQIQVFTRQRKETHVKKLIDRATHMLVLACDSCFVFHSHCRKTDYKRYHNFWLNWEKKNQFQLVNRTLVIIVWSDHKVFVVSQWQQKKSIQLKLITLHQRRLKCNKSNKNQQ